MVRSGRTYSNLMVDLVATNGKLHDRAITVVEMATGLTRDESAAVLERCSAATSRSRSCTPSPADPPTRPRAPSNRRGASALRSTRWWSPLAESYIGVDVGGGGIRVRAIVDGRPRKAHDRGPVPRTAGRIDVVSLGARIGDCCAR